MLKRIFSYMKQYKKYACLALLCIAVEAVLELMVPMIMADLIDNGVANGDTAYIYTKGLQMAGCAVLALILGIGSARFSALAGQGLGANIRQAEYEKLQSYSFPAISAILTSFPVLLTKVTISIETDLPLSKVPIFHNSDFTS